MKTKTNRRNLLKRLPLLRRHRHADADTGQLLGKNGSVAPSNRIVVGGIGLGPRGRKVLVGILRSQGLSICRYADVQRTREIIKRLADREYGNSDCVIYDDMSESWSR